MIREIYIVSHKFLSMLNSYKIVYSKDVLNT
jgi:hypothetical protein